MLVDGLVSFGQAHRSIGVLFGCFARQVDGDSWFTWWFNHLPGPRISPKKTPGQASPHVPGARWFTGAPAWGRPSPSEFDSLERRQMLLARPLSRAGRRASSNATASKPIRVEGEG